MVESVSHFSRVLPETPATGSTRIRNLTEQKAARLPLSEQRRTELLLVAMLALLYGWATSYFEPAFAQRPGAGLVHLLLLLAGMVAWLGLWDALALLSLRHLLRRDCIVLWRNYGHPRDLQRRLDNSTFELDSELGGGLLAATLRRFAALGRPESDFVARHLAEAIRSSRIGAASLTYAAVAAPILGVLGAAAGLRASLGAGSASQYSETALGIVILGLSISLLALLFARLLGASLAQDCASLLAPVLEAARSVAGRGKPRKPAESVDEAAFEKRLLAWAGPPWSKELRRLRTAGAVVSWLVTAVLIVLVSLPGGFADQWLGG